MTKKLFVIRATSLASIAGLILSAGIANAAPPTKEDCIETHSRAQDYREKGQMADAKRLFLLCAQQSCPALIQSDCSKFGEELGRSVPSVSFSARDARGNDLPDAQVFVDNVLVASRLDDGKAHDIDPGKHTVKFVRGNKEASVNVVVAVGEKGRNINVTFGDGAAAAGSADTPKRGAEEPQVGPSRPIFPLIIAGVGGAALVTGTILGFVGLGQVPSQCTTSPRECAAAPGDPVFDDARSAINLANLGLGIGIVGAVLGVGGLVWYFSSSPSEPTPASARIIPYTNGRDGGAAVRVTF
jgi:hypothetical protein